MKLPCKSVTPFLGIWYINSPPPPRLVLLSGKATVNEEKGSLSICEIPVHQPLQQGTSNYSTREFRCESPDSVFIKLALIQFLASIRLIPGCIVPCYTVPSLVLHKQTQLRFFRTVFDFLIAPSANSSILSALPSPAMSPKTTELTVSPTNGLVPSTTPAALRPPSPVTHSTPVMQPLIQFESQATPAIPSLSEFCQISTLPFHPLLAQILVRYSRFAPPP